MVDTTDEWIMTRIGIKERRILRDADKGSAYLGARAVEDLFRKTGLKPEEVDLLICCTVTADMHFPANGNVISDMVGIKNAFSFDLNAGCSGFLYGLITATQYVESGRYKKVIVVGLKRCPRSRITRIVQLALFSVTQLPLCCWSRLLRIWE